MKDLDKTSIKMESIPDHIKTKEDFNRTYGDCFISGFQYGGGRHYPELNSCK